MFARRAIFKRASFEVLVAWVLRLSWAIACATCPFPAFSEPVPIWAVFAPENSDLPGLVSSLMPGADGALWIGTFASGLARFDKDGRWQAFNTTSTSGGLPDDVISALAPGADGSVWVGTGRGLARLDKGERWLTYNNANTNGGLPDDEVQALTAGADDSLWVGTKGGLALRDRDGRWQPYSWTNTKGGLPDDNVQALTVGADGSLWVGTGRGLARLDKDWRSDWRWQTYNNANTNGGLPHDSILALAPGADGSTWVGTAGGLARIDKDGHWQTYTKANTNGGLPHDTVRALVTGADGALWIGVIRGGGLARLDKDGRWRSYTRTNTHGDLPDDIIPALAVSADGSLWVGTGRGLARLDKNWHWQGYSRANTNGSLPNDDVLALAPGADGSLWVGTGGGLARLDKGGRWQNYSKASTKGKRGLGKRGLPNDTVYTLAPDADGALWVGTGGGLARLDKNEHWQTYNNANTKGGLPEDRVLALALRADGSLWVGTGGGLARLDKDGRWRSYTRTNTHGDLPDDIIPALAVSADGALWVGTGGGLARLDKNERWQTYNNANTNGGLPHDTILALAPGADGSTWVGTYGGGLARLDKDGRWRSYSEVNTKGGLPMDDIFALTLGADDAIWVGTLGHGLARLDKNGRWQIYNNTNTNGGLPHDNVSALTLGADGSLWVGTGGGLSNLRRPPTSTHRIVEVIGEIKEVTQSTHNVSVVAFDGSYHTAPWMFHYVWRMTELGLLGDKPMPETRTKSPVYRATFDHDGYYRLQVNALDRYGAWSEPRYVNFKVALPKRDPFRAMIEKAATALATSGALYFALIFPLIPLYPRFSWVRTALNSGVFTKFPFAHKTILNTRWARAYLFRQLAIDASAAVLPKPYIPQFVFAAADKAAQSLGLDGSLESLTQVFAAQRRALLIARSGTGKSVFLRYLQREVATRFRRGERVPTPVLIDLRTHVLSGRKVQDLVRDALRGAGVELADGDLDFLIGKGGFLILVDSLNELPDPDDARLFHTFFNQDAGNLVLVASQVDLIRRQDTPLFNLAEVTPEQAASYLADFVGHDVYTDLPPEAQALARNPQDLRLLAEVAAELGTARVPTHRAELYGEILNRDGALKPWVESGDPLLATIYGLAFRMVTERRVLQDDQLREWIAAEPAVSGDDVAKLMQATQASRLFRREMERGVLGKARPVTGFRHELIGKFLAARHVRRMIAKGADSAGVDYVSLSGDELWLDMFYFVIDEIDSAPVLNRFLREILAAGGPSRKRITAYAIGTRRAELGSEVLASYEKAKLEEDLALTPAA